MKKAIALLCATAMLIPTQVLATAPEGGPKKDNETETETTVTYSYLEFGSYPQTEVVSQASDSGVYGKAWATSGDYIVDASLYNTLKGLDENKWDANGDATVDGNKYRRIKKSDATTSTASNINYYEWSSDDTYHYFKYEPIKWRILEQSDGDMFLLSEIALDDRMYNTNIPGSKLTWETSTIRSWLNGYDSSKNLYGTDYSNSNFIDTAFTDAEQSKIKTTTQKNKSYIDGVITESNDTNDKIYLLSDDEVNISGYGFASNSDINDVARRLKSSTYAKAMGAYASSDDSYLGNCYWWSRSLGSHPGLCILIRDGGSVYQGGQHANSKTWGVRPALHISSGTSDGDSTEGEADNSGNAGGESASGSGTSGGDDAGGSGGGSGTVTDNDSEKTDEESGTDQEQQSEVVTDDEEITKVEQVKNLKLTRGKKKITVRWTAISGASGYKIYRSTKKSSGYKCVKTVKGGTTKFINKKLKSKKRYYFKIRAYITIDGKTTCGAYSTVKSVKTK